LSDGQIELMVQRRILCDDNKGLVEPLNERDSSGFGISLLMNHYLVFDKNPLQASEKQRMIQYNIDTFPLVYLAQSQSNTFTLNPNNDDIFDIDYDIAPFTKFYIRPYKKDLLVVRLHNLNENEPSSVQIMNDDKSLPILKYLLGNDFGKVKAIGIEEVTLNTVLNKEKMLQNKYTWGKLPVDSKVDSDYMNIALKPLEMRVFAIKLESQIEELNVRVAPLAQRKYVAQITLIH